MKKLLLASILFCTTIYAIAQNNENTANPTDQGHFIVDGSLYFSTNNYKSEQNEFKSENKSFGVGISPKAAYFIIDRLALGLETSFTYSEQESTNNNGTESSGNSVGISVGPFIRYYLSNGFFGQASFGVGASQNDSNNVVRKSDFYRYNLGIGYAIFLNQHISIEPLLSYQHNKSSRDSSSSTNNGFTLGAGFTMYL